MYCFFFFSSPPSRAGFSRRRSHKFGKYFATVAYFGLGSSLILLELKNASYFLFTIYCMTVKEEKEYIFIEVADTGKGFPEDIKEVINKGNLLEMKKVTTRQGISLAKETLNKHDGDLIILDNDPHGAIVRVKLRKIKEKK